MTMKFALLSWWPRMSIIAASAARMGGMRTPHPTPQLEAEAGRAAGADALLPGPLTSLLLAAVVWPLFRVVTSRFFWSLVPLVVVLLLFIVVRAFNDCCVMYLSTYRAR